MVRRAKIRFALSLVYNLRFGFGLIDNYSKTHIYINIEMVCVCVLHSVKKSNSAITIPYWIFDIFEDAQIYLGKILKTRDL